MLTLVFFSTTQCGYCKPIKTMLENLKKDYADKVIFTDIIVDTDPNGMNMAREWKVNAVPTLIIIHNMEEKGRLMGDINREKVVDVIEGSLQPEVLSEQS